MRRNKREYYRLAVWILALTVVAQWLIIITLARPRKVMPAKPAPLAIKGKIAIVLDDWGYNLNNLYMLEGINYPLTMAILPHLPYSNEAGQELHNRGFELILHLPMEPHESVRLEKNTIMVSDNEETIRNILENDLGDLPHIKGVSNHMGSRATENLRVMDIVFRKLKKRHLYFLDSLACGKSICGIVAKRTGLPFARRNIFLDNKNEPGYIKGQLYKLKMKARATGGAIGIGHDRKLTLEVLRQEMPKIEKEGYRFVFVSELVK